MIDYPKGTITATLLPITNFCLDFHHTEDCHSHFDDVGPRDIVECNEDEIYPGSTKPLDKCSTKWELENQIYLVPIPDEWNSIPHCTKVAEHKDHMKVLKYVYDINPKNNDHSRSWDYFNQFKSRGYPYASCQWKGTTASLDYTCECGTECIVRDQWFLYNVMCPQCRKIYHLMETIHISERP